VDDCSGVVADVNSIVTLRVAFADLLRVLLACGQQCCKEQVGKEHVLSQPQDATAARVSCRVLRTYATICSYYQCFYV
jgi:hypothetical protein